MKNIVKKLSFIFWMVFDTSWAANILGVFTASSKSHFGYNVAIMRALADVGHNVTVVAPFSTSGLSDAIHFVDSQVQKPYSNEKSHVDHTRCTCGEIFRFFVDFAENNCHKFQKLAFVQDLLHTDIQRYDVMFVEMLPLWECYLPLARKLRIPVITTLATRPMAYTDWKIGNPHHLTVPNLCSTSSSKMSFFERVYNVFEHLILAASRNRIESMDLIRFYRQYYPNYEIATNSKYPSLSFINTHVSVFPRPMAPTVIEIAGIQIATTKPLVQDVKEFMEDAKDGVILISFGSRTDNLGNELIEIFTRTIARLPQRFIWKLDDKMENPPPNVLLRKWIPQQEILAHNSTKLFITHCGANSLYEAIHTTTPLVMIPKFGDQNSNAVRAEELGVGVHLNLLTITEEKFYKAIQTVLHDSSYKMRMEILSNAFKHRPIPPQKAIVYWTEYVLKYNGTKHLQTMVAAMPIYRYLFLDIFAFVIIAAIFVIFVIYFGLRIIYTICNIRHHHSKRKTIKNS